MDKFLQSFFWFVCALLVITTIVFFHDFKEVKNVVAFVFFIVIAMILAIHNIVKNY